MHYSKFTYFTYLIAGWVITLERGQLRRAIMLLHGQTGGVPPLGMMHNQPGKDSTFRGRHTI